MLRKVEKKELDMPLCPDPRPMVMLSDEMQREAHSPEYRELVSTSHAFIKKYFQCDRLDFASQNTRIHKAEAAGPSWLFNALRQPSYLVS